MVKLPSGFSPIQAAKQFGAYTPWGAAYSQIKGGDATPDFDVFSDYSVKGGDRQPANGISGRTAGVLGASVGGGSSTTTQGFSTPPTRPDTNPYSEAGRQTGGTGTSGNEYQLAQLAAQEGMLRDFLGRVGGKLNQGLQQIDDDFGVLTGKANEQFGRATRDYNTKEADTNLAREQALGRINTNANVLANSLRQRVGRASGSGSSAYQITAPGAVAREASLDRSDVQDSYGSNFRDLTTARKDTESDYQTLLGDYNRQKADKTRGLREGFEDQMGQTEGQLGDIARQRSAIQGGGVNAIRAAGAPYDAQVAARQQAIDSLFNQYRSPYQSRDINTQAVNLRDYVTNRPQVTQQQQQAGQSNSPYAQFLQPEEDEQKLF